MGAQGEGAQGGETGKSHQEGTNRYIRKASIFDVEWAIEHEDNKLICSIDIGTTFTGLSYCELKANGDIDTTAVHVDDWPGGAAASSNTEKVPTEIESTNGGKGIGSNWGYAILADTERHIGTKLLLEQRLVPEVTATVPPEAIVLDREASRDPSPAAEHRAEHGGGAGTQEDPWAVPESPDDPPKINRPVRPEVIHEVVHEFTNKAFDELFNDVIDAEATVDEDVDAEGTVDEDVDAEGTVDEDVDAEGTVDEDVDAEGIVDEDVDAEGSVEEVSRATTPLPEEILARYLERVRIHLFNSLDGHFEGDWRSLDYILVVTFPAVWSETAKDRTLKAVALAGFNTEHLPKLERIISITEPEAAVLHVIRTMKGSITAKWLRFGCDFIVCDLGGGTADLVSYHVCAVNPIRLVETAVGIGSQCGSTFIDRRFILLLHTKLGDELFHLISGNLNAAELVEKVFSALPSAVLKLLKSFEKEAKKAFTGRADQVFKLDLPAPLVGCEDHERGLIEGQLHLDLNDMVALFKPTLDAVLDLIREMIRRAPRTKAVILVGGLSQSEYMVNEIQAELRPEGVNAIKPVGGWSAVSRGALWWGVDGGRGPMVQSRKCRRHYGVMVKVPFVEGIHAESDKEICDVTHVAYAKEQMHWLVAKGANLPAGQAVHASYDVTWAFELDDGSRHAKIEFKACDADVAPNDARHEDVFLVGTLSIDLTPINVLDVRHKAICYPPNGGPPKTYYLFNFSIDLSIEDRIRYSLVAHDKAYGSITIEYN
ncbi:hypothetical protein N0V90_012839 [Kalmusia sp. IMI 367209]|nr:hypothetical protein N0V90_012839 [Kalmusia sp. IMI 367209]